MSMWRCPHCGTPQAETARCWVCRRSSTTCSTCRNFRQSVAGQLGYCGLDRRRVPLTGLELRGCWEPGAARSADDPAATGSPLGRTDRATMRDFIPVELVARDGTVTSMPLMPLGEPPAAFSAEPEPSLTARTTLFREAEV